MLFMHLMTVLIILWHVCNLVLSAYVAVKLGRTEIRFTEMKFMQFYQSLCQETLSNCLVTYSKTKYVTEIVPTSDTHNRSPCNVYTCKLHSSSKTLMCTRSQQSCMRLGNSQSIEYINSSGTVSKCVTFYWNNTSDGFTDYSDLFYNSFKNCEENCSCMSTTRSTQFMTNRVTAITTKSTAKRPSSTSTAIATTTTSVTTIAALTINTPQHESYSSTRSTINVFTKHTEATSADNTSVSVLSRTSDDQTDTIPIIIGLVIPLVVLVVTVILAFFLWSRKKGCRQKPLSNVHDYVNFSTSSVTIKNVDITETNVNTNHNLHDELSNYSLGRTSNEYSNVNFRPSETRTAIFDEVYIQSKDEIVYSNSNPPEIRIINGEGAASAEESIKMDEKVDKTCPAIYSCAFINNTLDETDDNNSDIYTFAQNTSLDNKINHMQIAGGKTPDGDLSNGKTRAVQNNKDAISKEMFHSSRENLPDSRVTNEGDFMDYQNIQNNTSLMDKTIKTKNIIKDSHAKQQNCDPEYSIAANIQTGHHSSLITSRPSDNASDEYSLAVGDSYSNKNTLSLATSNVYAKLGENITDTKNPYNVLLQETPSKISTKGNVTSSIQDITNQQNPYSVAVASVELEYSKAGDVSLNSSIKSLDSDDPVKDISTNTNIYFELMPDLATQ